MEKELFIRLAICVGPEKGEAAGLSADAIRSMGIGVQGLGDKERAARRALKQKVLASARPYQPGMETFPGLGPHPGFPDGQQWTVGVPADLLEAVARKIVRGSEYALRKRIVEVPYDVRIYFVHDQNVPEDLVRAFQSPAAQNAHLGPGFRLFRVAPHDDPDAAIYKIVMWETVVIYGVIMPYEPPAVEPKTDREIPTRPGETGRSTSSKVSFPSGLFRAMVLGTFASVAIALVVLAPSLSVIKARNERSRIHR
jgi:hypothetical protein